MISCGDAGTARPFRLATIPDRFKYHVRLTPHSIAVTDDRGGRLSYAELDRQANQLAHYLRGRGVRAGAKCAVAQERSAAVVVSILGILKAGAAYVPIDPVAPRLRIAALLDDANASTILTDSGSQLSLQDGNRTIVLVDQEARFISACPDTDVAAPLVPGSLAYVIYTSGSTGLPKGVLIEHGSVTHFVDMVTEFFNMSAEDRIVQCAPLWFDVSVFEIFGAILSGGSAHVAGNETKNTPFALQQFMRDRRITVLMTTPSLLEFLDSADLPDLRVMSVGGEPFSGALTTEWAAGRRFVNGYGPAEATVEVVAKVCEGSWDASPPIGSALPNHRAYVLDERMQQIPDGIPGELYVGGPGVARGYLDRAALTGQMFLPDPFSGGLGSRLYRTGDLVSRLPGGDLQYLGRVDRQVKIRGMRVELEEVESALARYPDVRRAVAVVTSDHAGESKLVAFIVARQGTMPGDVTRAAAAWLPSFMMPTDVIVLDAIPLTDSGKVDTPALETLLSQKARDSTEAAGSREAGRYADAEQDTEQKVKAILGEVLGFSSFGVNEDIFAIGANSLQVLRVLSRVRSEFGVALTPLQFFEDPTVAGIAAALAEELSNA